VRARARVRVCIYMYIYLYIHTHTHTHTRGLVRKVSYLSVPIYAFTYVCLYV
jgi:hypothetical protein